MADLTNQDVLDFIRQLVNLGNALHLEESNMTIINQKGEEVCVSEAGEVKPVQILFSGMVRDENKISLNPFKVVEGANTAQRWFYETRIAVIGTLLKKLIVRLVEIGATKDTEEYENISILEGISEVCDKTMVDELNKINVSDYLRIFYNKKNKTAEPQTLVFTDAIEEQYKSIRKKTWHALAALFRKIFKLDDDESTLSKYGYKATLFDVPEIDSKLHVMGKILEIIGPLCRSFTKTDVFEDSFNKHLANLPAYVRMYAWFTSKAAAPNSTAQVLSNGAPAAPQWTPQQSNTQSQTSMPVANQPATMPVAGSGPALADMMPVARTYQQPMPGQYMPQATITYSNAISPNIPNIAPQLNQATMSGMMPMANQNYAPALADMMPIARPYQPIMQQQYYQQPIMPMQQPGMMPIAQQPMEPTILDDGRIPIR